MSKEIDLYGFGFGTGMTVNHIQEDDQQLHGEYDREMLYLINLQEQMRELTTLFNNSGEHKTDK